MPTYELTVLFRALAKPEITSALRRTADAIFDQGGFIRHINNLGVKPTPYKIGAHGVRHKEAHYFVVSFDAGIKSLAELSDSYRRDVDVIRTRIYSTGLVSLRDKPTVECTLHEDLLPPPYRKSVKEMMEKGKFQVSRKPKFDFGPGLDHYLF